MISVTRRDFLRIASLMGGASLFAGCNLIKEAAPVPQYIEGAPGADPVETLQGIGNVYTVCGLCPGNCGISCRVAQGVVVKIGGNPYHPIALSRPLAFDVPMEKAATAGGAICAIGGSGVQTLYDPFRVARPLKRVGPRGSRRWKAISWPEAVNEIVHGGDLFGGGRVDGLQSIRSSGQGLSLLVGDVDWGALTFIKSFLSAFQGAALFRDHSVMLHYGARIAADSVFGEGTGPVDAAYGSAQFVLSFGDAPLDTGVPLVSIAREIADARIDGRLRWAVADPRLSTSGSKADMWVPAIPGADVSLALGIMKALTEEHSDAIKVPRDNIESLVAGRTVDDLAAASGVSSRTVRLLAAQVAEAGPRCAVVAGRGILGQPDGPQRAAIILSLNRIVGSMPGTGGLAARNDQFLMDAGNRLLPRGNSDWTPKLMEVQSKALVVWAADPVYDDPGPMPEHIKDQGKVPLVVTISTHITETAAYADYILPDTTYLERWDICQTPPSVRYSGIGARKPVVGGLDPATGRYFPILPQTKPMEEIFMELAAGLKLPGFGPEEPERPKNAWQYYQRLMASVLKAMKEAGLPVQESREYLAGVMEKGGVFIPTAGGSADGKRAAKAPSFLIKSASVAGVKSPGESDEFILITYALPFHRSPGSGLNSWLLEIMPENKLLMNSRDARKLSIGQYQRVIVESPSGTGKLECKVQLMPGIRPGVVALARGFGYRELGAAQQTINGETIAGDKTREAGVNPDAISATQRPLTVKVRKA